MQHLRKPALALVLGVAGCVSTNGLRPQDLSAAQHEATAREQEALARREMAQYASDAREEHRRCSYPGPRRSGAPRACWIFFRNPTREHLDQAAKHLRRAAFHRASSAALRGAEDQACRGLSADERGRSPLEHIVSVSPLLGRDWTRLPGRDGISTYPGDKVNGAVVTLRAVRGLTAERLQRRIDCQLARSATLGHSGPEEPDNPLVLRDVEARVRPGWGLLEVELRAADRLTALEVLDRAERLIEKQTPASSTSQQLGSEPSIRNERVGSDRAATARGRARRAEVSATGDRPPTARR